MDQACEGPGLGSMLRAIGGGQAISFSHSLQGSLLKVPVSPLRSLGVIRYTSSGLIPTVVAGHADASTPQASRTRFGQRCHVTAQNCRRTCNANRVETEMRARRCSRSFWSSKPSRRQVQQPLRKHDPFILRYFLNSRLAQKQTPPTASCPYPLPPRVQVPAQSTSSQWGARSRLRTLQTSRAQDPCRLGRWRGKSGGSISCGLGCGPSGRLRGRTSPP